MLVSAGRGYFDWAAVRGLLHVGERELEVAVAARAVLCVRDGEGTPVFPAWQFSDSGDVLPFLSTILQALSRGIADPWTWAMWLTAPGHGEHGESAVDLLASGADPRAILRDAVRDAARWAT